MKKNKVLSGIMAGVIALSMSPVAAFAAETDENVTVSSTEIPVLLTADKTDEIAVEDETGQLSVTVPTSIPLRKNADGTVVSMNESLALKNYSVIAKTKDATSGKWTFEGAPVTVDAITISGLASGLTFTESADQVEKNVTVDTLYLELKDANNKAYAFANATYSTDGLNIAAPTGNITDTHRNGGVPNPVESKFSVSGVAGAFSAEHASEKIADVSWTFSATINNAYTDE